jgi:hypothetical protein
LLLGNHLLRAPWEWRTFASHLYAFTKDEYLVKRCINHRKQSTTAIYIRVTYQEVEAAIQAQADRFCSTVPRPEVLPALAHRIEEGAQYGAEYVG